MNRKAYTVKQLVNEELGGPEVISQQTVYEAIRQGIFPGRKLGTKKVIIFADEYEAWKAAGGTIIQAS